MIKKIGVLTSGGDAPGMNNAIRAVVRTALTENVEVYGINNGYYGLYHNDIHKLDSKDVGNIINRGGTFLGSARFPEFKEEKYRLESIENLKKHEIDALVVIGGDGSFMGAKLLTELGYPCVGIPGTIDNDIAYTDFTIGFYTALNTIVEAVDKLRDTSSSHQRCSVIETMGRHCGDLALWAGIASGAEATIVCGHPFNTEEIIEKLKSDRQNGKRHFIIIVAEGLNITQSLAERIEEETGIVTRATILGHIQRGGSPTAEERVLAARLGSYAVELLMQGKKGICVGIRENHLIYDDIIKALEKTKNVDEEMYNLANRYLNN